MQMSGRRVSTCFRGSIGSTGEWEETTVKRPARVDSACRHSRRWNDQQREGWVGGPRTLRRLRPEFPVLIGGIYSTLPCNKNRGKRKRKTFRPDIYLKGLAELIICFFIPQ